MTNFALNSLLKDLSTVVEYNTEEQNAIITDPTKFKVKFYVSKSMDNSPWFVVSSERPIAQELQGHYTSVISAIQAVCTFIKNSKESFAVKSDELDKDRKQRNASKTQSKDGKLV